MSIEKNYSIAFIAEMALREKQIQQNYRPIIAVHKWFARRPGTLFRGLILSELAKHPIEETYFQANSFNGKTIADPFMGGGTPLLEANRVGCDIIGTDINPMAAWVVQEEIGAIDLGEYREQASKLISFLTQEIGELYKTRCIVTGRKDAEAKYFLWIKTAKCKDCASDIDLFPGYVVAEDKRHTSYVLACQSCGDLNNVEDPKHPGSCACGSPLCIEGRVTRNKCTCPTCGAVNSAPFYTSGPPTHRLFAIEYHNADLTARKGRLFKKPDAEDIARAEIARKRLQDLTPEFIPDDEIPNGDETKRLHRWGYNKFNELFNPRQLLALELTARYIAKISNIRIRRALATNFSDLLRYQNMVCRYDTMALKSLDIFSIHGFPVGYVQAESNFIGIRSKNGVPIGSGGWANIIDKYSKAKGYCTAPFEVYSEGKKKITVPVKGEWIGETNPEAPSARPRKIDIKCLSATEVKLKKGSLDAVLTDPPYYGMVQYGELMHFCYVWLRKLMGSNFPGLELHTTKNSQELTGNSTESRGIAEFAEGLAAIYTRMAQALKPGAPLAFTYHHNKQEAYLAVGMAILDAGLNCSASLPCPAEMGGSIHIHGTGSSIIDTVFVCRNKGDVPKKWLFENAEQLCQILSEELGELRSAGVKPSQGDIRCIAYGHITRMAVWNLWKDWDKKIGTNEKLSLVKKEMDSIATLDNVISTLESTPSPIAEPPNSLFSKNKNGSTFDAITF